MNRIFGFSRNALTLVGIVVAIILVMLVGAIVFGSAAIRALMVPGLKVEGVSLLALLVTIIVLLVAVFIMLLVLFWCCCKSGRTAREGGLPPDLGAGLLPLLPVLPMLLNAVRDAGVALYEAGTAIDWTRAQLDTAAGKLEALANTARDATTFKLKVFPDWTETNVNPLSGLESDLRQASNDLKALGTNTISYAGPPAVDVSFAQAATDLIEAGKTLARVANALHVNPPPPGELLQ